MLTKTIVLASVLALSGLPTIAAAAGQDAGAVQKGEQLYGAQKCMTCHAIAGKGNKNNPLDKVGAKLSAADTREWIVNPVEMAKKVEVDREAANARQIQRAGAGRDRRPRRLHAKPEVARGAAIWWFDALRPSFCRS